MNQLFLSITHRPYVFAFLAAYAILAWRYFGIRKTVLWLVSGYAIAWLSEVSSINNGFPYGDYKYVYESMKGELMIAGVPFFDSLSYPFLTFAGYVTASFILCKRCATGLKAAALGALLTMLLDVIVDPIATMGDRWFLGQIHYYVHPGWYFGVPFSNFAGWFLVSFAIIGFNVLAWHIFPKVLYDRTNVPTYQRTNWLYPAFYSSIALFNVAVTFSIGEWKLGISSSVIIALILSFCLVSDRRSLVRIPVI